MNRLYIFEHEKIKNNQYLIKDTIRINHIDRVLHKEIGDHLKILLLNKGIGNATLVKKNKSSIILNIEDIQASKTTYKHLLIALCRPPSMKKIIEHATTLGAASITFFPARHSEKSYANSHLFHQENIEKLLCLGLAQSGCYSTLPKISLIKNLDDYDVNIFKNKFIFSLDSKNSLSTLKDYNGESILLAIGPERGWIEEEEVNFTNNLHFKTLSLGQSILRTEIATYLAMMPFE